MPARPTARPPRPWRHALVLAAFLAPPFLGADAAAGQSQRPGRKPAATSQTVPAYAPAPWRAAVAHALRAPSAGVPVVESEPNDTPSTATVVTLGDELLGVIDPDGDLDYFAVQLAAGVTVEFEVVASRAGSQLDSYLRLFAPDGTTLVAENDDWMDLDSRIRYTAPAAGRYHLMITDFFGEGAPSFTYRILTRALAAAPGDPTTLFASVLPGAWGAAAGPGALYVVAGTSLLRLTLSGQATTLAADLSNPLDVAVDVAGNVLVTELLQGGGGRVTRIQPNGTRTPFATLASAVSVTIGPGGDVWIADPEARRIHRYHATGAAAGFINVGSAGAGLMDLAFSPADELHFSDYSGSVFRIRDGAVDRVIQLAGVGGLAFDRDGYLYVGTAADGIALYDPQYNVVDAPFAVQGLDLTGNVVFLRSATGAMTSRLLGVNLGLGTIREVSPTAVRAPGLRIGTDPVTVDVVMAANHLLGATGELSEDVQRFLDQQGNRNGRFDLGDLQAYLRATAGTAGGAGAVGGRYDERRFP